MEWAKIDDKTYQYDESGVRFFLLLGDREALLIDSGMFFCGDSIQDGRIFMFGPMRDLSAYIHSLRRLDRYKDDIKEIYSNHGTIPLDYTIVPKLIDGAMSIERGELTPKEAELFGQKIHVYDIGAASFLCD
jgi:glyoxylase-like metal-dependent hydrolase (beta-lactamase superfamily II)